MTQITLLKNAGYLPVDQTSFTDRELDAAYAAYLQDVREVDRINAESKRREEERIIAGTRQMLTNQTNGYWRNAR